MVRGLNAWIFLLVYSAASLAAGTDEQRRTELEPVLRLLGSPKESDRKAGETELFKLKDLERSEAVLQPMVDSRADPSHTRALLALARLHHVLHQGEASPIFEELVRALQDTKDADVQIHLLEALGYGQGDSKSAAPSVEHYLDAGSSKIRIAALRALADIGYTSAKTLAHIRAMLTDPDKSVQEAAADAFWLLGSAGWGADAVPDLTLLLDSHDMEMAKRAAMALSAIGPAAAPAVPRLRRLLYTDPQYGIRFHSAWALGAIGPAAAPAVPDLLNVLATDKEPGRRVMFIEAFGKIGVGARTAVLTLIQSLPDARNESNTTAARALAGIAKSIEQSDDPVYLPDLYAMRSGLVRYRGDAPNRYRQIFDEEGLRPVDLAIGHLEGIRRAHRTALYSSIAVGLLIIVVALLAVPSLSRAILIWRGRRWSLGTTECHHTLDILQSGDQIQLSVRSRMASAASTRLEIGPASDQPHKNSTLQLVRQSIRDGEDVLMTVDETLYHWHWAALLGVDWSAGKKAIVCGQVCAVTDIVPSTAPFGRHLRAAVLLFEGTPETASFLPFAGIEAACATQVFKKWRARVTFEAAVGRQQFADALRQCDVVHLAAHATEDELMLSDGPFGANDLPLSEEIRCRWLVLSACRAGNISDRSVSLVYKLVRTGVNVLAAVDRIDDVLASEFFSGVYRAWLPRRLVGRTLAEAIRESVQKLASPVDKATDTSRLADLNRFVLYGDPSLQLKLVDASATLLNQPEIRSEQEVSVTI